MGSPPEGSGPGATEPPDRQTLQLLARHLRSDALVAAVSFDPDAYEPRVLSASIAAEQYPDSVVAARLDIRWFTTGDFSFHYVESHQDDSQWECRWVRRPNPPAARVHFHQPPTATATTDLSLSSCHPLDVYSTVLDAIERRIETLWAE
jgi:hypothetical protein